MYRKHLRGRMRVGFLAVALLVAGVGGLAALTDTHHAVRASGSVIADLNIRKIQPTTGGIIGEIRARDGDRVAAGDIMVRLDNTIIRATLALAAKGLDELQARKARLEAERDGWDAIKFPGDLMKRTSAPEVGQVIASERWFFETRRLARLGQKQELCERITRLEQEIAGYAVLARAKASEISLIEQELKGARDLRDKGLVPISRLTALEREAIRLEGEQQGQLVATIAQARGRIAEIRFQILQIDRDHSSEVERELRDAEAKFAELIQRKLAAEDQLGRLDVRAPHGGIVRQPTVHTVGDVITAGEDIMAIAAQIDTPAIEARIAPRDVDQLRIGQTAVLNFSAPDQRTAPEISGTLSRISPDTSIDQPIGRGYYTARIAVPPDEIARLGSTKLVPGMTVEVSVQPREREVFSQLIKPLGDRLARAFQAI